MKKFIIGLLMLTVLFSANSVSAMMCGTLDAKVSSGSHLYSYGLSDNISIKEENGFMVLDCVVPKNTSKIVTKVISVNFDYIVVENVYDKDDIVYVGHSTDLSDVKNGDVLIVTFNHDDVATVEKNKLSIGDKVFGQIVID